MIIYTVHEPQRPAQSLEGRADSIVFVKEGFTIWGFLFGALWLLFNRLWIEFIVAILVAGALTYGLVELGFQSQAGVIADLLLALIIGFEGNDLLRWALQRRGYALVASVAGRNRLECERRFFDAWLRHAAGKGAPGMPVMGLKSGGWRMPDTVGTWPEAMA